MDLVLRQRESFYDMLLKYIIELFEAISHVFKFITLTGCIAIISYLLYYINVTGHHKKFTNKFKCNLLDVQKIKNYNRMCVRQKSIISHKNMLKTLEKAASKCHERYYALKCIDIVVHCPQLLNIKSPPNGLTPFHRVCLQGNKPLIAFMLAKGADPTLTTVTGENALCMAIHYFLNNPVQDDFSCLKMLVDSGCRFGLKDKWYSSFLKMAVSMNHMKLVQWLILHQKSSTHKLLRCSSTPPITMNTLMS